VRFGFSCQRWFMNNGFLNPNFAAKINKKNQKASFLSNFA